MELQRSIKADISTHSTKTAKPLPYQTTAIIMSNTRHIPHITLSPPAYTTLRTMIIPVTTQKQQVRRILKAYREASRASGIVEVRLFWHAEREVFVIRRRYISSGAGLEEQERAYRDMMIRLEDGMLARPSEEKILADVVAGTNERASEVRRDGVQAWGQKREAGRTGKSVCRRDALVEKCGRGNWGWNLLVLRLNFASLRIE
ncbi:hypothetical protein M501DRAFT_995854 [Patellaria atrata CBS 101060]|uniref:Uncharacterized protein n=1 Tax=Patellaria atrata CBS 101060 TaxID=1346257 RepID=A0A9P4S902_9PEZI|nr:hypothetical protein M501DRAFT_995854 [Patellaria atrata CBS 101060]